ncbi:serine O-acetyltransferase [Arthrobacter gengyunqii]|uniref:serine O-acetyltransferase n=1 Tax=Arthrobacter gengyunqii TaxID=2886940 RepID=UPI003C3007A2
MGRPHIQLILVLFRLAQQNRRKHGIVYRALDPFFSLAYRLPSLFLCGIDIPVSTRIGPRLSIHHGLGVVVNAKTVIGSDVTIRQGVTLGNKAGGAAPVLGDAVEIGASALVIGAVEIGSQAVVGAGAVVTKSVRSCATVVGNPARELRREDTRRISEQSDKRE